MEDKTLPCNCPLSTEWFENFNIIRNYFIHLGGLAYEILQASGLKELDFFNIFNEAYWADGDQIEKMRSFNRIIALEVYIDLYNDKQLEKAYLFYSHTNDYYSIYKDGVIKKGKLVLTKEKLAKWAKKGYGCILCRETELDANVYEEYVHMFHGNVSCRNIKPWKQNHRVASRGYKEVFLVLDYLSFGDYYFEVDFYAIDTFLYVLKQEKYIREHRNPLFRIENVDRMDLKVLKILEQELEDVFLREMGYDMNLFPEAYKELTYLTAYLKYHYPDIQDEVNCDEYESGDCSSLGIELASNHLLGANVLDSGAVEIVRNQNVYGSVTSCIYGMELEDTTIFPGRFSLLNAGVALSEIGVSIRSILKSCTYENIEHAVICLPARLPQKEEIYEYIHKIQLENTEQSLNSFDVEIFEELDLEDIDAIEIIQMAAQMAGLTKTVIVPRAVAIVAAYENEKVNQRLLDGQYAFVYDWSDDFFFVALIQKKNEELNILWQEAVESPTITADSYVADGKTLVKSVQDKMYDIVYTQKELLQCMNLTTDNKEVWDRLYASTEIIIEQLKNDRNGNILLENSWASIEETFHQAEFESVFESYYLKTEKIMKHILERLAITEKDISRVYISGEWGNYSGILKKLERFLGRSKLCVMAETKYAPVVGAAYLAKNAKEKI